MNRILRSAVVPALALVVVSCSWFTPNNFDYTGPDFELDDNLTVTVISGSDAPPTNGWLSVKMHGRTRTVGPDTIEIPVGLFLMAETDTVQNVVILRDYPLPASEVWDVYVLGAFCCNRELDVPTIEDTLRFGKVSDNVHLLEIADIIKTKDLNSPGAADLVQDAVWDVVEKNQLTQETIDALNALPGK
jgi:hypothetical protein